MDRLVKHYENTPASDDEIQEESRREMKAKVRPSVFVICV